MSLIGHFHPLLVHFPIALVLAAAATELVAISRPDPTWHAVAVANGNFAPAMTAVPVGTTVTWTNRDDVPHNIVSTGKKFASPVLDTDEQFSYRFDERGTYPYYCSLHPKMTGQIVVG
jgi:plastocyanin